MIWIFRLLVIFIGLNINLIQGEKITSKNEKKILTGEWLIKFYADWCSGCQQFAPIWDQLSIMDYQDSAIRFGEVNIDQQHSLSVKYSVKYLPTIYHIKDGVVRLYEGPKDVASIEDFINNKKYLQVKPPSWYNDPNGFFVAILLQVINGYEYFMEIQQKLMKEYGYSEKVSLAICYSLASLLLLVISFVFAICLIPVINFFLPKQPQMSTTSTSLPKSTHVKETLHSHQPMNESEEEADEINDSNTKPDHSKNSKPDVRERKRNQQKKRSTRE